MLLNDIIRGIEIVDTNISNAIIKINKISTDSRTTDVGDIFVCIRGENQDSHEFINEALSKGAEVIIIDKNIDVDCKFIKVRNTRKSLALMYGNYCGRPQDKLKIIAVTGTNGKTTTTHMLKKIYEDAGYKCALIGTVTNTLTTPVPEELYPLLSGYLKDGVDYVIMEASSHALTLGRLDGIKFRYGIFTNLTPEHLDFHTSMDDYMRAKAILFRQCDVGFLNYDDEYSRMIEKLSNCKICYYSAESDEADYTAKNIKNYGIGGIRYDFLTLNDMFRVNSPIPGKFTVYNTLAAISCAYYDGIAPIAIRNALRDLHGVPGRMEHIRNDRNLNIFIDYAHTPDALENVLKALREIKNADTDTGRLTVLFGCGGDRDSTKRPVMGKIASKFADFVIITSDNSRSEDPEKIINDIMRGIDKELPHIIIANRADAIKFAVDTAEKNDIILFAGKGHEDYEITVDGKHPFSERELIEKFTTSSLKDR